MLKKVLTVLCLLLASVIIFAGCKGTSFGPIAGGAGVTDPVESNGGTVVKKGNFYYSINGIEEQNAANNFPNVIKGAIIRTDLNLENPVVVVPKIALFNKDYLGMYIFDNYIYYMSPSTKKDSSGKPMTDKVDVCRTKLDGTGSSVLFTVKDNTLKYSIGQLDGKTYIYYEDTIASTARVGITSYCVETGKSQIIAKNIATVESGVNYAFAGDTLYYVRNIYKDSKTGEEVVDFDPKNTFIIKEAFTVLEKVSVAGGAAVELYKNEIAEPIIKSYKDGRLYYSPNVKTNDLSLMGVDGDKTTDSNTFKTSSVKYANLNSMIGEFIACGDKIIANYNSNLCVMDGENTRPIIVNETVNLIKADAEYVYYIGTDKDSAISIMRVKTDGSSTRGEKVCDYVPNNTMPVELIGDAVFFLNNEQKDNSADKEEDEDNVIYRYLGYMYAFRIGGVNGEENDLPLIGIIAEKDLPVNED